MNDDDIDIVTEELMAQLDDHIEELSLEEALEVVEALQTELSARINGLRTDIRNQG